MDTPIFWKTVTPVMRMEKRMMLTVSPPPGKPWSYYYNLSLDLRDYFEHVLNYKYFTYTEFGENDRIHWHGVFAMPKTHWSKREKTVSFLKDHFEGRTFIDCQVPRNSANWLSYVSKDSTSLRQLEFLSLGLFEVPLGAWIKKHKPLGMDLSAMEKTIAPNVQFMQTQDREDLADNF